MFHRLVGYRLSNPLNLASTTELIGLHMQETKLFTDVIYNMVFLSEILILAVLLS